MKDFLRFEYDFLRFEYISQACEGRNRETVLGRKLLPFNESVTLSV
jgi:hypothetical protein